MFSYITNLTLSLWRSTNNFNKYLFSTHPYK